jgi:Prephenate dehydrogenase
MKKVALMGAGGKMGCRITTKLKNNPNYQVTYVEVSDAGISRLKELGVSVTPQNKALADAEIVILAIPDVLISRVSTEIVPMLKSGTIVIGLDPAAAYAGVLPERKDITYFVAHPCHPPLFHDETDPKAMVDWFGGIAKEDVVCALFQGPEKDYAIGEALVRIMFGPIKNIFRITIEQMAILEPALVESFNAVLIDAMKEAMEEAIKMGVPRDAAYGFLMGHVRVQFAVIFGLAGFEFSDGAKLALKQAKELIFKPDWKEKIMNLQAIKKSVAEITASVKK